jgi:membrane-bound lytic murein transglycosylase D
MRILAVIILVFGTALSVNAESIDLDELLNQIDPEVLTNLNLPDISEADAAKLQAAFQGEYTIKLAPIRAAAEDAVRLLEQKAETKSLATLARDGLSNIATTDELHIVIPAPQLELPCPSATPPPPPMNLNPPTWPKKPKPADWPVNARTYVPQLKQIFAEEGLPAELVWVAEVESGFSTRARSRTGAVGLYQLMPDTAELLGLSLKPVDERFIPEKNARAAAQYLKYLHDKFGDWQLAIAAYNGGEGRVWRLLEQSRKRTYQSIATRLPPETQYYVTKVQDAVLRREGVVLAELSPPE